MNGRNRQVRWAATRWSKTTIRGVPIWAPLGDAYRVAGEPRRIAEPGRLEHRRCALRHAARDGRSRAPPGRRRGLRPVVARHRGTRTPLERVLAPRLRVADVRHR